MHQNKVLSLESNFVIHWFLYEHGWGLKAQSSHDSVCVLGSLGVPGEKGEKGNAGMTGPKGFPVSFDSIMSHKRLERSHVPFDF